MKKVSVIIPVYNMRKYIKECMDSVLEQTIGDLEVICIDDGSDDGSLELLREYELKNSNLIVLTQKGEGPGVARNTGIETATGEFVCMMDADDYYPNPEVLKLLYETALKQNVVMCGGNILNVYPDGHTVYDNGNFTHYGLLDSREYPRLVGQTRFVYNRDFLLQKNLRYLPYVRYEDPPFVLESIMEAGKYFAIEDVVYVRRTGYKQVHVDKKNAFGILQGIKKCTCLTVDHDLKDLFNNVVIRLIASNIDSLYQSICDGDPGLWDIIGEINDICVAYDNKRLVPFYDYNSFQRYSDDIVKMVSDIKEAGRVLVYGAGVVAERLQDVGYLNLDKVIGFMTSDPPKSDHFLGKPLKHIDEYESLFSEVTVIVAAGKNNYREMEINLNEKGANNYILATAQKIHYAKDILRIE